MSLASVTCSEAASSNTLTVNTSGPAVGEEVYLKFLTGGFTDGVYVIASVPTSGSFTVTVANAAGTAAIPGTVIVPKTSGYDNITNAKNATASTIGIATNSNTNLNVGDHVWLAAGAVNQLKDAEWIVASVLDERHFTVTNSTLYTKTESNIGLTLYPLVAPPLARSGSVALPASKFDMGNTNSVIVQTPMDSPTVFNFLLPETTFIPAVCRSTSVTAPEFQLTTDS